MYKNIKWCIKCKTKTLPPYKHDIQFNLRFTIIINSSDFLCQSSSIYVGITMPTLLCWYFDITQLTYHATVTSLCWRYYAKITTLTYYVGIKSYEYRTNLIAVLASIQNMTTPLSNII